MSRDFWSWFVESVEYPDPTSRECLLPVGTLYLYVSDDFLTGWINYVQIERAFLSIDDSDCADHGYSVDETGAARAAGVQSFLGHHTHTKISEFFSDPVDILARDKGGRWWYFGYDPDVSDCSIGRFEGDAAEVLASFDDFGAGKIELPADRFTGWRSF